jgi:hypothetical protein
MSKGGLRFKSPKKYYAQSLTRGPSARFFSSPISHLRYPQSSAASLLP